MNVSKSILMMSLLIISMLFWSSALKVDNSSTKVIVLDAGHGGKDRGCTGISQTKEKDITLKITQRLGEILSDSLQNVKVIYTRESDEFVSLWERAELANEANADMFVSIHCNAHPNKYMHGSETFVMGLHKSEENLKMIERENGVIDLEERSIREKHYPNREVPQEEYVKISLNQTNHLNKSIELASTVQDKVKERGKLEDLGVNQAGFVVLWKTATPSILVETGYLTNRNDEAYLTSNLGQKETALNIFEALKETVFHSPKN